MADDPDPVTPALPANLELLPGEILEPAIQRGDAPVGRSPALVRAWFDDSLAAILPDYNGTLSGARQSAEAYARRAKAHNTRRAYVAGVRAWCAWCDIHALPCLPGRGEDVAAFLAAERGRGLKGSTLDLRRVAICYLHFAAGCPVPTADAQVAETLAGIRREAAERGDRPAKKTAATALVLQQILAPIGDDLPGLRDRALLLVGFAGALRRSELAGIQVEHLEERKRGLHLTLLHSKGERTGKGVTVALPYGATQLCPVRALRLWLEVSNITEGPVFRRLWQTPARHLVPGMVPVCVVGTAAIDPRSVARIIQARAAAAGFDATRMGGHSLKRGALTTGMDRGVHPTRLKQFGRHKSYAVLDEYLEMGEPFENHPLSGVL